MVKPSCNKIYSVIGVCMRTFVLVCQQTPGQDTAGIDFIYNEIFL